MTKYYIFYTPKGSKRGQKVDSKSYANKARADYLAEDLNNSKEKGMGTFKVDSRSSSPQTNAFGFKMPKF